MKIPAILSKVRWDIAIIIGAGALWSVLSHYEAKTRSVPSEKAEKAVARIDTVIEVAKEAAADTDTLKSDVDSAKLDIRQVQAQVNEIKKYFEQAKPSVAEKIEKAADTVKPEGDSL